MDVRPIDANVLLDIAKNKYHDIIAGRYPFNIVVYDLVQIIEEQPTLDLAPVVHGEWGAAEIIGYDGLHAVYAAKCSVCGMYSEEYRRRFCGNCGAKMDGGKKDG